MPRSRFLFAIVALTSVLAITPLPSLSQSQGIPWYTIPLPVPGGFVDAATGNLHLEIPIASVSERNGDPLVSKLIYDTPLYAYNYNISGFSGGPGWRVFTGTSHSGTGFMASNTTQACPPGYTGNIYIYSAPSFTDSHGTTHFNNNQTLYTKQVQCYSNGIPYGSRDDITSFSAVASDGSGYSFNVSNYTNLRIFSPDGWLVYDSTGDAQSSEYPVDTNGNYARYAQGSQGDMLGRSPFQVGFYQCSSGPGTNTVRASDGSTNTYTFTCTSYSLAEVISGTQYTGTASFLTNVALPDGTQYSFTYDTGTTGTHLGALLSVTLPATGVIAFTPVGFTGGSSLPQLVGTATFAGGTWNLSYAYNTSTGVTTTTVTSPLRYDSASNTNVSDQTVFTSVGFNPFIQTAQYYRGSSTLLRTVSTTYDSNGNFLPMTVTTTLNDTGQSSSVSYQYFNLMRDYPTQKQETDFGGSVVRTTVTNYYGAFMKPQSVNVYVGSNTSGTPVSSTLYSIDEYSASYCKNGVPMLTNVSGATGHDANYGTSFTARGNVTTIQRLISGATYATTHMCYDTLGNVTQTVDANGNPTSYDYSDSGKWADTSCIPSGTTTHAFLTTITDALGHQTKNSYFTCTSLRQSLKDANDIQANRSGTTFTYDLFNRPLTVNYPDGGQTTYCYSHDPGLPCYTTSLPPFSTESRLMSGSTTLNTKTLLDAYNRVVETNLTSDPDCASGDKTDTTYDNFGRVLTVYNPYCSNSDPTYGLTTYAYDALGRTTQVTTPDSSTILTTYTGRAKQVQDEGDGTRRVTRISQVDGLGRLASVCEVTSASQLGSGGTPAACGQDIGATGFLTTYGYDTLDNLTSVSQSGLNGRTLQYDSLSRLTSASNPESGTTSYTYDANGNVHTKTDARNITTTYAYDALNRLTGKTYSDSTPAATFNYDQISALGVTLTNTVGRMSSESTAGSSQTGAVFSYDQMGRVADNSQCTPQNCGTSVFTIQYPQYDFLGDLLAGTNAAGVTFSYSYNTAGRLTGITSNFVDPSHPGTLFSSARYTPFGALASSTFGNGISESFSYDKRLRLQSYTATSGGTTKYSFNISSFAPNGDILSVNDSVNRTWAYSYDEMNRLCNANQSSTQPVCHQSALYTYDYDRFGNRWHQNGPQSSQLGFDSNNHITGVTGVGYDAAGDLTSDGTGTGSHKYFYDAEKRIVQVDGTLGNCSTATACYLYDAEGRRVRKTTAAGSLDFLYDTEGHKVAEVDTTGTFQRGELYASGRHFAVFAPDPGPNGAAFFIHADWLGTERARTNTSGTACETITSLPFGDGQGISDNCGDSAGDVSPMHFTGKERDSESNLDNFGARYYGSGLGRFMSPDPENAGADEANPQSWNAYSYVANNPLNAVDPDGRADCHEVSDADGGGLKVICTDSVTVTADQPNSEPVMTAETRTIVQHIGQAAQKSYDYLRAAYEAFVNSHTACVAALTAAGAYAAGYPLAETGAASGAALGAFGGPFDEVTVPAVSALGGLALGGYGAVKGGQVGYALGQAACSSGTGNGGGSGSSGGSGGGQALSSRARKKLGNLAGRAGEKVRDVILSRGGTAANVNQAGVWADKTLGEAAQAAVDGNRNAETAVKIAKQAGRLGQKF